MADSLSIVTGVFALISAATSLISTAYDIDRDTRMLCDVVERALVGLGEIEAMLKKQDTGQRGGGCLSHCCWTEVQKLMSDPTLKRRLRFGDERHDVIASARCLRFVIDHCRSRFGRGSQFWRLQRYMTSFIDRLPPSTHDMLAGPFKHPSPSILLLSWLVLAIAVVACYREQTSHQHRRHYLIGSMLMAFVLGEIEGSGMTTIVLTNMPWSLTLGMLLYFITGSIPVGSRTRTEVPPQYLDEPQDLENIACKVGLT